jgi:hypothetical protein
VLPDSSSASATLPQHARNLADHGVVGGKVGGSKRITATLSASIITIYIFVKMVIVVS